MVGSVVTVRMRSKCVVTMTAVMYALVMNEGISHSKAQAIAERHNGDDGKNYELANGFAHNALNRCLRTASILSKH